MNPTYAHANEMDIYASWEKSGAFNPDTQKNVDEKKQPFTILLPPPNANASLHAGHGMFVVEDILIRFNRMLGRPTLWVPGTDHAGFETQYVYEKHLSKQGKSRFQFDRQTLYNDIFTFVENNSGVIFEQLKRLGFSCDWSRSTFMLDEKVIHVVYDTFQKMVRDELVYRDNFIVNYSPKNGTTFSDLEVTHVEKVDPLYYIKYGPFLVATVRPETKFRDIALACNPNDPRYKDYIGKTITFQGLLGPVEMKVLADDEVDMEFGTGIMKVTPAHDAHDFELGRKYKLPVESLIDFTGRMDFSWFINQENADQIDPIYMERAKKYHGKKVAEARKLIVEDMKASNMIDHVDEKYSHNVSVDYKTGSDIEPMVMPNWFVKTKPLAKPAIEAAKKGDVTFVPSRFEKTYYQWMENIRDWPISRQIVWGIRIPVWYSLEKNPTLQVTYLKDDGQQVIRSGEGVLQENEFEQAQKGLQKIIAPIQCTYEFEPSSPDEHYLQETDTFDTWFSSGQWPLTTLGFPDGKDFTKFFPTQVMDTMWDILFFWVARMIMFSLYRTNQVPFDTVYLHSMVTDEKGAKMSKSKGNVINPIDLVEKYGADSLRMALIAGSAPGNPIALSESKVKGYRNFANKLWNIGRFITMTKAQVTQSGGKLTETDTAILAELNALITSSTENLTKYRFSDYALNLYDFIWNKLANEYLETTKAREDKSVVLEVLTSTFSTCLALLHPVMPFVTESIWQELGKEGILEPDLLITHPWPNANENTK